METSLLLVIIVAGVTAVLTGAGALVAEYVEVPRRVMSHALQFAGGVLTGLVVVTLMAPAVVQGPVTEVIIGFFLGGALFVLLDGYFTRRAGDAEAQGHTPLTLYVGILVDMVIDGLVIGLGSTLTLAAGMGLAFSIAVSTAPLALVSIATARSEGRSRRFRLVLSALFMLAIVGGAAASFLFLRNQSMNLRFLLVAVASGFLLMTVTQSIIPEANRDGEPNRAALSYIVGISLYALFALSIR